MNKGAGNRNGTQVVRLKNNTKQTEKKVQPKPKANTYKGKTKGPVRIGENTDPDKWRCKTCKHLNDKYDDVCKTCDDPNPNSIKKEKKEENNSDDQLI